MILSRFPSRLAGWFISIVLIASVPSCATPRDKSDEERGKE